jgi:hypothetical protein
MESYQVGSNIDSWCTKCKLVLAHTIEAISAGLIKRVQCNTCRGKHQFKSEEPGTKSAASAARSDAKKSSASSASSKGRAKVNDLARLMRGRRPEQAAPYSVRTHFSKGDLLEHTIFGLGVVVDQRDAQKIEVLFPSGSKVLIHARLS